MTTSTRSFSKPRQQLIDATTAEDIICASIRGIQAKRRDEESPPVSVNDIAEWFQTILTSPSHNSTVLNEIIPSIIAGEDPEPRHHLSPIQEGICIIVKCCRAADTTLREVNTFLEYMHLNPTTPNVNETNIEQLHKLWLSAANSDDKLAPPLMPLIKDWYDNYKDPKFITPKYNRQNPVAIIERSNLGSIRDVVITKDDGGAQIQSSIFENKPPSPDQLSFLEIPDEESKLPTTLPFETYQKGIATTKAGAVSMPVRLAFESLMQMDSGRPSQRICWRLGDLIDYLNPDKKFQWHNQIEYVLKGLNSMVWLRFPYKARDGEVDWIPFLPRTVPNHNSNRDSRIIIDIDLPPGLNNQGMLVEKNVVRLLGKKSSAKFNAYLNACWLIDKYGTNARKLIDPTMPSDQRDDQGYLIDAANNRIYDDKGKPIRNNKTSKAAKQLDRVPNPDRKKYPILTDDDIIRSCFPNLKQHLNRREYLRRAKAAWQNLEDSEFVRIEKFRHGWRIMPSDEHVKLYRAVASGGNFDERFHN